ncbi:hypothetical protein [Variovorax sp. KK3]|uniref:hypothetical protein n=1 Tax=Variovorax sp. KK3 TaxID=1855728 RepID=UPI00117C6A48|nr:hypothetical protein [Variovorax sp. KK3]
MKTIITLVSASVLSISLAACASGTTPSASTSALTMENCKAHLAQFVPLQNKNDAALAKDTACANMVKK